MQCIGAAEKGKALGYASISTLFFAVMGRSVDDMGNGMGNASR
jgi:hypothetical protein